MVLLKIDVDLKLLFGDHSNLRGTVNVLPMIQ
jgi:hypothetical protein